MRWLLPKSLNGFLLLGLSVLAVPLLVAILNATVELRRLAESGQRLVSDGVQTTRLSRDMYAQVTALERSARLYQVLRDAQVLGAFRTADQSITTTAGSLYRALHTPEAHAKLARLSELQDAVRSLVLLGSAGARQ